MEPRQRGLHLVVVEFMGQRLESPGGPARPRDSRWTGAGDDRWARHDWPALRPIGLEQRYVYRRRG